MPQITLEYTSNILEEIVPEEIFLPSHKILVKTADAKLIHCKSKTIRYNDFFIGDGDPNNGFVHMQIYMIEGRSIDVRKKTAQEILAILEKYFKDSLERMHLQITVDVKELSKALYYKLSS